MKILLSDVRICYTNAIWEPKRYKDQPGSEAYSTVFIIEPGTSNLENLQEAMYEAVESHRNTKPGATQAEIQKIIDKISAADNNALRSGDDKEDPRDEFVGNYLLSTRSKAEGSSPPKILDRARNPVTSDQGLIYPGCRVNALVDLWYQDVREYGKRINCALLGIQFVRDDDPMVSGVASASDFEDLGGEEESTDNDDVSKLLHGSAKASGVRVPKSSSRTLGQ